MLDRLFGRHNPAERELMAGREVGENINLAIEWDGLILTVSLDDEVLLEGTRNDAMFAFLALAQFLGRKTSKQLLRVAPADGWKRKALE